jgi:PKD repeat protein
VTLMVESTNGLTASSSQALVIVDCPPPIAAFTPSALVACAPATITFADASSPGDGVAPLVSSYWDFGDGATLVKSPPGQVTHTYTQGGAYVVGLTVVDTLGHTDTATQGIEVHDVQLDSILDVEVYEGEAVAFPVTYTTSDGSLAFVWANGVPVGASFAGGEFSWSQAAAGSYALTFTAQKASCEDSQAVSLTVYGPGEVPDLPPDSDLDGAPDQHDACPADATCGGGSSDVVDSDLDGVPDGQDNCVRIPNTDQMDSDDDGVGDACSKDTDLDGVVDGIDNCRLIINPEQDDLDFDRVGDACDVDIDNDGIINVLDNCVRVPNTDQLDGDQDGVGDACSGINQDITGTSEGSTNAATDDQTTSSDGVDADKPSAAPAPRWPWLALAAVAVAVAVIVMRRRA